MGYYTNFDLSVDKDAEEVNNYLQTNFGGGNSYLSGWLDFYDGDWSAQGKWYEHEDDMKVLSSHFPDVLFTLHGDGEETGDLWVKYFKNGKMQTADAVITYEPFDESKLS